MRRLILALAASTLLTGTASATSPLIANGDYPYWKLNLAQYDTTYASLDHQAHRFASFRRDDGLYCRYRSGWQGAGSYHLGDRFRTRMGWDGGYPWQGPGVAADHEDAEALVADRADYARAFGREPVCGPVRHHRRRHHEVVLRRKD